MVSLQRATARRQRWRIQRRRGSEQGDRGRKRRRRWERFEAGNSSSIREQPANHWEHLAGTTDFTEITSRSRI